MARTKQKEPTNGQATAEAVRESLPVVAAYDWAEPIQSPLKRYPGAVLFPKHFNMHHYRAWMEINSKLQDIDDKAKGEYRLLSMGYTNGGKPQLVADCRQWAHVLAVADMQQLENLPEAALEDESGESTPIEVLSWLIPLTTEVYLAEKLNLKN